MVGISEIRRKLVCRKKINRPTARDMNTAVWILRSKQIGLSMNELEEMDIGFVLDLFIESGNDDYKYPQMASQADIDRL